MIHRYSVTVAGQARTVELEALDDGRLRVVLDGTERVVDARQVEPGVWSILEQASGRGITAQVSGALPQLVVDLAGFTVPVEVADARSRDLAALAHRTGAGASGPAVIRAPIPGRVVKILVKAGETVKAGQGIIVLE